MEKIFAAEPHDRIGALLEVFVAYFHVHHSSVDIPVGFGLPVEIPYAAPVGFELQAAEVVAEAIGFCLLVALGCTKSLFYGFTLFVDNGRLDRDGVSNVGLGAG